ncbi:phage antirepressor KilAC domain-containing protein [Nostoc sp. UHCC 0870]|uniref:phage antirepressor KilAC domain-containing protein n=1 Tax=Nostoc sp. UHCC 0870 TaxID=2914041 RepID=UPI001EDF0B2F|nr:phage antirepressor KilAC domain-containing protein [Nostoc sp. UHCC 0870]UKO99383.1 phage antirepressor KilAC domain-containing protein [Nostoc sp. UHCC 0870]
MGAEEEKQLLSKQVLELAPKAEIFDIIANDDNFLSLSEAAKLINSPGLGRNKLMVLLRDKGVLQMSNLPYQKYVDQGYFVVVEKVTTNVGVQLVTKVTQKGISFLIRLLQKEGYTVPSKSLAA